jgi:hypothetical protein
MEMLFGAGMLGHTGVRPGMSGQYCWLGACMPGHTGRTHVMIGHTKTAGTLGMKNAKTFASEL